MNAKEKAAELLYKYEWELMDERKSLHVKLAIIAVDEILNELAKWGAPYLFEDSVSNDWAEHRYNKYWLEVKAELEAL